MTATLLGDLMSPPTLTVVPELEDADFGIDEIGTPAPNPAGLSSCPTCNPKPNQVRPINDEHPLGCPGRYQSFGMPVPDDNHLSFRSGTQPKKNGAGARFEKFCPVCEGPSRTKYRGDGSEFWVCTGECASENGKELAWFSQRQWIFLHNGVAAR